MTTFVEQEIHSQPECWQRATALAATSPESPPLPGERVAVVGCGTSWFIAQAYACKREAAGQGWTDAFTASEFPISRNYDRIVAITRSGTTTEVISLLHGTHTPTVVLTGVPDTEAGQAADVLVDLSFADEQSVVQTRFATTALAYLRASLGEDMTPVISDGRAALERDLDDRWLTADQITFLGQGWTYGLANEAALKLRESGQGWAEAYPAMDYRHGPISIAEPGRLVWSFGPLPEGLYEQITATGALAEVTTIDPQAHLITAQRMAIARALYRGLDPDHPRNLTRSVILSH